MRVGTDSAGPARRRRRPRVAGPVVALLLLSALGGSPTGIAAQDPLERRAGLHVEGRTLDAALRLLQRSAGVSLVYSPDLLPDTASVDCACEDVTVRVALESLLEGTGLTFVAGRTLIRIVPEREPPRTARGGVIVGRVVDDVGGLPIVNAKVRVSTGAGVLSDARGAFALRGLPGGVHTVEVESMGWRRVERGIELRDRDTLALTIRMAAQPIALPMLVVAPGTFAMLEDVSPGAARMLTREEVARLPQVGEDVLRAVKRLPGVASDDISTRLHVRGSTPREVSIRLDGLELVEPYHLKDWNGVLGIVDVHALGGVELTSGGFGPKYGGKSAAVLDMTSRSWVGDSRTTLGASISNVTALTRGSFGRERGAWLVSARRGFLDLVFDLIDQTPELSPQYYDLFGKLSYEIAPGHVVSVRTLLAGDAFAYRDHQGPGADDVDDVDVSTFWDSRYAWASWEASPGPLLSAVTILSTGRVTRNRVGYFVDEEDIPQFVSTDDHRTYDFFGVRSELSFGLTDDVALEVGAEGRWGRAEYEFANQVRSQVMDADGVARPRYDSVQVDLDPSGREVAAYAALRLHPLPSMTAEVGARYDAISHTGDRSLSPRVLAALDLSSRSTLRASWGVYRQSHELHELEVGDGATEFARAERAEQVALGLEHRLGGGIELRVEAYRRMYTDQLPVYYNARQDIELFPEAAGDRMRIEPEEGRTRGLELVLERRSVGRWSWSAAYALASAEDRIDGAWTPRSLDQRHTFDVHASFAPTSRWDISTGWRYHTGWPATAWAWNAVPQPDGSVSWYQTYARIRGEELPDYHRLDVRVTREFVLGGGVLHAFVDLFNVYDRTNLGSYAYSGTYSDGRVTLMRRDGQEQLPRMPLLGLRYEF